MLLHKLLELTAIKISGKPSVDSMTLPFIT